MNKMYLLWMTVKEMMSLAYVGGETDLHRDVALHHHLGQAGLRPDTDGVADPPGAGVVDGPGQVLHRAEPLRPLPRVQGEGDGEPGGLPHPGSHGVIRGCHGETALVPGHVQTEDSHRVLGLTLEIPGAATVQTPPDDL